MKAYVGNTRKMLRWTAVLLLIQLVFTNLSKAQAPDCITGTVMYGIFTNVGGSGTADSTDIRPINYSTGAVGNLMGNKRYWIRKQIGGTWFYGASAMGLNPTSGYFYVNTQMSSGSGGPKDIIAINTMTATMINAGTTPASMDNYHMVKMAISPTGLGYAIGVHRDSSTAAATFNPLIRFSTCGLAPSNNCANGTIVILGYLPTTALMYKWDLFNGDISFDAVGNLYFATAAFWRVNGLGRYTDARLFRINAADIPAAAGAGTIPMSLVAEYNGLDSTVVNGLTFDPAGNMYWSTRRFLGVQASPAPPSVSEIYSSWTPGASNNIATFGPVPVNKSIGDLAGCYFPATVLAINDMRLSGKYSSGQSTLNWNSHNNDNVVYYEIQRSVNGEDYETIARIDPINITQADQSYSYNDASAGNGRKYYRVRQIMANGSKFYSNVININVNARLTLNSKIRPNPIESFFDVSVKLINTSSVMIRLIDQNGRVMLTQRFIGQGGDNKFTVNNLSKLSKGVYIAEISVDEDVVREKVIKQ